MIDPQRKPSLRIDEKTLHSIASKSSGLENFRVMNYEVETVTGGLETGLGVHRIKGTGLGQDGTIPWQAILKTYYNQPDRNDPQASHYWRREANFYVTGHYKQLPDDLRAPLCYEVINTSDQVQIYLEDLEALATPLLAGAEWTEGDFKDAAACLGRFNGRYLTGEYALPVREWMSPRWMRVYIEEASANVDLFYHSLDTFVARRAFNSDTRDLIRQIWEGRQVFLDLLESLPQTYCHQDAFHRNLFLEQTPVGKRLVAIDWSYTGVASVGSELVPLISCCVPPMGKIPCEQGFRLADILIESYLAGLGSAGWQCNPDLIRFSVYAGCAMRYPIGAIIGEGLPVWIDEANFPLLEKIWGGPLEEITDTLAEAIQWSTSYYEKALTLQKKIKIRA